MRVLVADDEEKLRETVYDFFTFKGAEVDLAKNGQEAVDLAYEKSYDIILLDVMMPIMDGIEACKEIRQEQDVPIIFLTALGAENDLLSGYNVGADDYVVKPFSLAVLFQKCQVIVSRYVGADKTNKLTISGITLDFGNMTAFLGTEALKTTQKDFSLLAYLMKNKGVALDREAILTKVWGYDYDGDTRVVDTHIKRIRKILRDKGKCIVTKINVGYMFEEI